MRRAGLSWPPICGRHSICMKATPCCSSKTARRLGLKHQSRHSRRHRTISANWRRRNGYSQRNCLRSVATRRRVSKVVLDASALLAVLRREPGREVVEPLLVGAAVSAVNYSEVIKKSVEAGGKAAETRALLRRMDLVVFAFDEPQAVAAGALFEQTRSLGLSLADRACLG